jgi:acyl phosphate:glycerol-3-phosphate acyltransferase
MTTTAVLLIIAGFLIGSLPFSVWIGRYGLKDDIRRYGDHNPGAFNVLRAGGIAWGGLAIFLDIFKGALTVGLAAHVYALSGLSLILAAAAPPFGHAFSPLLRFTGGKAIAAIAGMWLALTLGEVFVVGLIMLLYWYFSLTISGWAVMFTYASVLLYFVLTGKSVELYAVWAITLVLLIWKHRADLSQPIQFRVLPPLRPFFKNAERL